LIAHNPGTVQFLAEMAEIAGMGNTTDGQREDGQTTEGKPSSTLHTALQKFLLENESFRKLSFWQERVSSANIQRFAIPLTIKEGLGNLRDAYFQKRLSKAIGANAHAKRKMLKMMKNIAAQMDTNTSAFDFVGN
jgi:hypothetical protein